MSRFTRAVWNLLAVATLEAARLFPGVGRLRGRADRRDGTGPESDLDVTLRRFRRAVTALWLLNALLAVSIVAAVVVAV